MALPKGKQLALYLLMGTHSDADDGRSAFRAAVKGGTPAGTDFKPAFLAAAQGIDPNIQAADIGSMPDLKPETLRAALGLDEFYPGGAGPCPSTADSAAVYDAISENV